MKIAALASVLGAVLMSPATQDGPARVVVRMAVENANGVAVTGLQESAFSISVDGRPHPIVSVTADDEPLAAIVMIDRSRSMRLHLREADAAFKVFTGALSPGDRVRLASFADEITFAAAFTTDRTALRSSRRYPVVLHPRQTTGGSPLWDAIHDSVELLAREEGRRAVVVYSDGRSTGNWHSLAETAEFALAHGVSINVVALYADRGLRQNADVMAMVKPTVNLEKLATYTGGALVNGREVPHEAAQFEAMASRLRGGYRLSFDTPFVDGRAHQLDIAVHAALQVRAPRAFRAPASKR
jgi:VWFA-related protein